MGCHMYFIPQPPYFYFDDPLDDTVLFSSIAFSTLVLNKDQSIDGVGVAQPTCTVIHEEYDWELEHHSSAKDHSLLSDPPLFLTSLLILPSMISHVYLRLRMHPLLIIRRTHHMLVHHLTTERKNHSLKILLIFHLIFPETQRVNFSASHLPLCLTH